MDPKLLARKYHGEAAASYDRGRVHGEKWMREQCAVEALLKEGGRGARLLDIPVGTGRFIELYQQAGFVVTGGDVSDDMLNIAREKAASFGCEGFRFLSSNIFNIDAAERSYDFVLCVRFLNWLKFEDFKKAVGELVRVANGGVVLGVRHYVPVLEIKPWKSISGARMLIRQLHRRLVGGGGLVFHEKSSVYKVFEYFDVLVAESVCVERRRDGTDYYIYRLVRRE